jgi:hypothetical protein
LNQYLKGDSNLFKEILLNSVSYIWHKSKSCYNIYIVNY